MRLGFITINLAGAMAFAFPFFLAGKPSENETLARSGDAPWLVALFMPVLILLAIGDVRGDKGGARTIALLGVLASLAALMRIPLSIGGANLIFLLPIITGATFGPRFGFLLGALAMAASAAITGGFGPWLPFQMWATGWIGAGAGLLSPMTRMRSSWPAVGALAAYGYVAGFMYGALINLYFWPVTPMDSAIGWSPGLGLTEMLNHYRAFYLLTSLPYDALRGVGNAVAILLVGAPALELLRRYRNRFAPVVVRRDPELQLQTAGAVPG